MSTINSLLSAKATHVVEDLYPLATDSQKQDVITALDHRINGYGFLNEYLENDEINEIMINSSHAGYIETNGRYEKISFNVTEEELLRISQKIAWESGNRFDKASPIVDGWLSNGSRFHAVMPPVSPDGICITIRKYVKSKVDIDAFSESKNILSFIKESVENKKSIAVTGGTSTGKTTFLNAMLSLVKPLERVITIEETAELTNICEHQIRLIAKSHNTEGKGEVTLSELVKASLRMRPDRIVVGEVRSKEAFDLIQALNTGHSGSMCSIHSNGASELMHRLVSLAMFAHPGMDYDSLLKQAFFGLDLIVLLKRRENGVRFIHSIHEVVSENGVLEVKKVDINEY